MTTRVLGLTEIIQSQSNKHITHNTALHQLDAWTAVLSRSNGGPPGSPTQGDAYIVDATTGDWSAFTLNDLVVYYQDSNGDAAWVNVSPATGPSVYVADESLEVRYDGVAWAAVGSVPDLETVSSSKTLDIGDRNTVQRVTAAATITVPTNAAVQFAIGTVITIRRAGAGAVTVSPDTGVTINGSVTLASQHDSIDLMKVDTDEWDAY